MDTTTNIRWLIPLLFIPTLILIMAIIFHYKQPKQINHLYGYRTSLSMKSQDTWVVANRLASECFLYISIGFIAVLILLSIIVGKAGLIGWFGSFRSLFLTVAIFSTGLVLIPIVVTEYKLKRIFTSDGIRR